MPTDYYEHTTEVPTKGKAYSSYINARFGEVAASFALIPQPSVLNLGNVNYGTSAGSANAYTVTMAPVTALAAYTDHMRISVRFHAANTATSTINVSSLGAKSIKRADGSALQAGDIGLNQVLELVFDATADEFRINTNLASISTQAGVYQAGAMAWAINAEDSAVSATYGGNGSTTFSSLHWSAKAEGFRDQAAAYASDASDAADAAAASAALADSKIGSVVEDTTPQLGGTLDSNDHAIQDSSVTVASSSGTVTLDCSRANHFRTVLTENITTVSLTNVPACFVFSWDIVQDSFASGYTVTLPASFKTSGGAALVLTSTASAEDTLLAKTTDTGTTWKTSIMGQDFS